MRHLPSIVGSLIFAAIMTLVVTVVPTVAVGPICLVWILLAGVWGHAHDITGPLAATLGTGISHAVVLTVSYWIFSAVPVASVSNALQFSSIIAVTTLVGALIQKHF